MSRRPLAPPTRKGKKHMLPAVWMRAGTSKGLFIHRHDLPSREDDWAPILLSAMGSKDCDSMQLDGIGGATSTTSKVAVIVPSRRPDVDVDYTFAQVAVGASTVDMSGNCGNIASGVGPFAIDEGLVEVKRGQTVVDVRIFNTNTGRTLVETLEVDEDGLFVEEGTYTIPGVQSPGSRIRMAFERPAGSKTGRLLPTGSASDFLDLRVGQSNHRVRISAVDAANPFVFVDEASIPRTLRSNQPGSPEYLDFIETVRRQGAVHMGLADNVEEAGLVRGTPKIAVVSMPSLPHKTPSAMIPDVKVTAFSMGKVHASLQMTGAVPLAVAACTEGTVVHEIAERAAKLRYPPVSCAIACVNGAELREVAIEHAKGIMPVVVETDSQKAVLKVTLSRTARRLFEGQVAYYH
ncbi:hypothetical protein LTR86_006092 [Recurvomyces mirabilis]|nr:hypothetical protein LTR86_006092 [Recurvomyces mirabilis]